MKKRLTSLLLALVLVASAFSAAIYTNAASSDNHTVSVSYALENGIIAVDKENAREGDIVKVAVIPNVGYITKAGSVIYYYNPQDRENGVVTKALVNRVQENAIGQKLYFTMPDKDVTVYAEFLSTENNNYSFDIVASSVKSEDKSFQAGKLEAMSFVSRLYYLPSARNFKTGAITLKKDGATKQVAEIGTLYAKTEALGATTELTLENFGTNGIQKEIAYTNANPLEDSFSDITNSYIDFSVKIDVADSKTDYTVKSYIKFDDGAVVYSKERTDFADNVAARLDLCETNDTEDGATVLTISQNAVNNSFEGFGVVINPWTNTCHAGEGEPKIDTKLAIGQAKKEVCLMGEAGIKKVRLIYSSFPKGYYDFENKQAKPFSSDWYTKELVDMFRELKKYDIEVQLNFGWGTQFHETMKNGTPTTGILGSAYSQLTVEEQYTAYGQLAAELTYYLLRQGCDNITSVTFFSEPGAGGWSGTGAELIENASRFHFANVVDVYNQCAKSVEREFANKGINDIEFVYGNLSLFYDEVIYGGHDWWNGSSYTNSGHTGYYIPQKEWFRKIIEESISSTLAPPYPYFYSYHYYGKFYNDKQSNYANNLKALNAFNDEVLDRTDLTANDIFMDEVSVNYVNNGKSNDKSKASPFEATQLAEYLSTLMNGGYKGAYLWTFANLSKENMFGLMPNVKAAVNEGDAIPYDRYYATALITKYLNDSKTIYPCTQAKDGCITVMGKNADGQTTVMVVNMNHISKKVKVELPNDLGKTLNRHLYNPSVNYRTIEAKIIGSDKQLENVSSSFTDTIPAGGVAIYTTK